MAFARRILGSSSSVSFGRSIRLISQAKSIQPGASLTNRKGVQRSF
ncbi:hypothetical protein CSB93_4107 [Pseudomonas paraeruginosa]|uniref:Uncharacterized protein n=1 Tax=Pseudomonas paraeruginosa TaxID=2994495 RepID=A0A2R3IRN1_9PSED|nr:hypothetical protein CSB93_4107 [Pseudomonas paraeruginosa]